MPTPSTSSYASPSSGFHPDFVTEIKHLRPLGADFTAPSSSSSGSNATCNLHLLYTLDNTVILDQYQLGQLHSEGRLITSKRSTFDADSNSDSSSKKKTKGVPLHAEMYLGGQMDLEAPVSALRDSSDSSKYAIAFLSIPMASSSAYNETNKPPPGYEIPSVDVTVSLPIHLRYQEPVLSRYLTTKGRAGFGGGWWNKNPQLRREDIVNVEVTWPCVFWACDKEPSDVLQDNSPYRKMEASSSCLGLVPQELRDSVPSSSPLHPSSTFPHHYLLPFDSSSSSSSASADSIPGKSIVRVPTGVLGDLKMVSIVNLAATWIGVALIARQAWKQSRKWKAENKVRELKAKSKEKKSL